MRAASVEFSGRPQGVRGGIMSPLRGLQRRFGPRTAFLGSLCVLFVFGAAGCDPVDPSIRPAAGPRADVAGQAVGTDAVSPDNPDPAVLEETRLAETALGLLDAGRYEQAEQLLRGEVDEHSEQDRLRFLLGIALQKQKRYGSALVELDRALESGRRFRERRHADHFRGWCLFYLGRPEAAAAAFRSHLEVMPGEADSHFGLGVALLESGDPEAALPAFESAIALTQTTPDRRRDLAKALIRRGDAYWELDRIEEAQASFQKGIVQFPDHYEGWAKLARAMDRLGDGERAERARYEEQQARIRVGATLDDTDSTSESDASSKEDLP
jgi:tetratricopeptide (TPR) repeat protein